MQISTISFEIRDFRTGDFENFRVENTISNQEKILAHRCTRNIRFEPMFDFQFAKERHYPTEMIDFSTETENELDEIDEMVGVFA